MIRKLRVKLVYILMALLTVMLGVTFGLVLHFTQQSLEAESLRTLEALANNWQTASSPGLDDGTRVPYFALEINARGDIITTRGGYFDLSDREKLQKLIDIAVNSEDDIGEVPDYGLRFYRVVTRTSWRVVFADTSAETTTLHSLIRTLAIASAAALAVFFVMSLLLARWLVRPVARAWDQQRQFVADASHELKTPLTVILTNAELLQAPGYDAPARSRFAGSILTMSQQMRGLVESLLELARVDAGRAQDAQTELDLSALVNDALLPFEPVLFEAGHTLTARVEDGIRVRGNASKKTMTNAGPAGGAARPASFSLFPGNALERGGRDDRAARREIVEPLRFAAAGSKLAERERRVRLNDDVSVPVCDRDLLRTGRLYGQRRLVLAAVIE